MEKGFRPPSRLEGLGEHCELRQRGPARSPDDLEIFLHFDALSWSLV